jgi:hypothetical protein
MELRPLFFGGRGSSETIQCKESRRTHTREKERKTSSTGRQRKSCIDPRKGCKHNNRTVAGTSTSHKGVDWLTLTYEERTEYFPEIIEDIAVRLRKVRVIEVIRVPPYAVMARGGQLRCRQGYVAPMIVQESQILQVSLFETIQRNLARLDFGAVLTDIMLIADEVDSQLTQTIHSFLTDVGERGGRLRNCRTMPLSSPAQIPLLTEN